mmetsp:Transcript_19177/g.27095  ORF Transcript_19177/g.27095 Transcript_19177/m.27095 type:complete len:95 (-) Transcript_19177:289-573(-)
MKSFSDVQEKSAWYTKSHDSKACMFLCNSVVGNQFKIASDGIFAAIGQFEIVWLKSTFRLYDHISESHMKHHFSNTDTTTPKSRRTSCKLMEKM